MRPFVRMIAATAFLLFLWGIPTTWAQQPGAGAAGRTRYFPAQKCKFTLPAEGWSWVDRPLGNAFVAAENSLGLQLQVTCAPAAAWPQMDERAAEDFERSLSRSSRGQLKKRASSFVQFHGLTAYQIAGVLPDGTTTVSRCFLAHQMAYQILIVGGKEPVEQDPDFDEIMYGFAFTAPPAIPGNQTSSGSDGCFGVLWFLLAALVIGLKLRSNANRKAKPKFWQDVHDDPLDEPHAEMPMFATPRGNCGDPRVADARTQFAPSDVLAPRAPLRRPPPIDRQADEREIHRLCVRFINVIAQSFQPKVDGGVTFMAFVMVLAVGVALTANFLRGTDAGLATGFVTAFVAAIVCSILVDRRMRRWRYSRFFRRRFIPETEKRGLPLTRLVDLMGRIDVSDTALDERLRGMAKALPVLRELLFQQPQSVELDAGR